MPFSFSLNASVELKFLELLSQFGLVSLGSSNKITLHVLVPRILYYSVYARYTQPTPCRYCQSAEEQTV